jgi:hypothetical protein
MIDYMGWIATVIMAVGSLYIAHKKVLGLWLMLVGNAVWLGVGYASGLSSLVGVSIMMGILDYYGIYRWTK